MIYALVGFAYVLFVAFLIRFFQAVHRWDDEIGEMKQNEIEENASKPKAA